MIRRVAEHRLEHTRLDFALHACLLKRQIVRGKIESDGFLLTGFKADTL
jgi:hypothetical protein